MRKLLLAALALLASSCVYAQNGQTSGILYASDFAQWSLPQGNSPTAGMIQWPTSAICTVSSNGYSFVAVKVGRPLTIIDVNPSLTETVTPVAVTTSGGSCTVTATMANVHSSYSVRSGTAGLQEAIDYSSKLVGGSVVLLTPGWTVAGGTTGMILAASGSSGVSLLDERLATICAYVWGGSSYASGGCGTGNASLNVVSLQTFAGPLAGPSFTMTGSQTANTFLAAPNGSSGAPTFRAMVASDVPTLNQNTTGTASGLSANITESQVTNLTTDLGNRALTSTTVNGHALSSNVTVSASDITTGTLPHAQLPALVSGDIPNNAANTSGTAGGLTGSPAITVSNVTDTGAQSGSGFSCLQINTAGLISNTGSTCGTGGTGFPSATDTFDVVKVNPGATPSIVTAAQEGRWDAVINGGADNTGSVDASTILNNELTTLCASSTPVRIHLAAGTYKVNSGILISATSTTCKNLVIEGDGPNTILQTTNSYGIWYDNTSGSGNEHFNGPTIRHLQIQCTAASTCLSGIRLTQTAGWVLEDLLITGFSGQTSYATGTISSTGSTINCSGCTFTSAMAADHGFIEVTNGTATSRAEIASFNSGTQLTIFASAFPTGNLGGGTAYAVVYGGDGVTLDPGTGYVQYGTIKDVYFSGNLVGIHGWCGSGGAASRVSVMGKRDYISPNPTTRITDSIGMYLCGADTFDFAAPINNVATGIVLDHAHANIIRGEVEDNSTYAAVTTCNGGVATQNCTQGAEVTSDANSHGWNNFFDGFYAYLVGTVYRFDNSTGAFNSSIIGDRSLSGQYTTHYDFYGTTTCPGNASGIPVIVNDYDCNHALVTQTVN